MGIKKYLGLAVLIIGLLTGCNGNNITGKTVQTKPAIEQIIGPPQTSADEISIGSFNIFIFGKAKRGKEDVMKKLVEIVNDYDIIAIQEFRDKTMKTVPYFLEKINEKSGGNHKVVASERLGRSSAKERYAFYYDNRTIEYLNKSFVYPDIDDVFEREPFIAYFKAKKGKFDFFLVNIHTQPRNATKEINHLVKVIDYVFKKYPDEKDVIVVGDLNADGGSYDEEDEKQPLENKRFLWVVADHFDTTVGKDDLTYDRILFDKSYTEQDWARSSGVDRFEKRWPDLSYEEMKKISDHYPIWAKFKMDKDTD